MEEVAIYDTEIEEVDSIEEPKLKINLNLTAERTSGLSLKSIKAKKEHKIKQMEVIVDEEQLPKDPFTEESLLKYWNNYISELHENGKKMSLKIKNGLK